MGETWFANRRFLVTGGTGTFGNAIIRELLARDVARVTVLSRDEKKQWEMRHEIADERLQLVIANVRDAARIARVFDGAFGSFDGVFHAAALKHVVGCEDCPTEAVKTNIIGASQIVNAAQIVRVPRLVAISTDKAVHPVNVMGMTKAIQERIVLQAGYTCVRYGNVIGSRGSLVPYWAGLLEGGATELPLTHVAMTRFQLSVRDAIDLALYAMENGSGGEVFVKKAPAARVMDIGIALAQMACRKHQPAFNLTGFVHGEKVHETLVSAEESYRTQATKDHYIIRPSNEFPRAAYDEMGTAYRSCDDLLDVPQIVKLLKRAREEQGGAW